MTLILVLTVAGAASAQQPRCWTNAQGVTECGTRPPPGVDARTINAPRPATNEVVEEAERFAETDPDAEEAQRLALQRSACELARETLAAYDRSEFLYERDPTSITATNHPPTRPSTSCRFVTSPPIWKRRCARRSSANGSSS
ncbi:MAG: hypothetical protein LC632_08025 [Xanthomonadaceae bacterium]|nr:hypothetical protein [Xanthomonadaceae bacterium]